MYKDILIQYTPIAIAILIIFTLTVKYINMPKTKHGNTVKIILTSFLFHDKQTIKNTFHKKLKDYYKNNHNLNIFFYVTFFALLTVYILMIAV